MKPASAMQEISNQREEANKKYWKEFDEVVSEKHLKDIETLMEEPDAVERRSCYYPYVLGKATIEHLESLEYTVRRKGYYNGGGYNIYW